MFLGRPRRTLIPAYSTVQLSHDPASDIFADDEEASDSASIEIQIPCHKKSRVYGYFSSEFKKTPTFF